MPQTLSAAFEGLNHGVQVGQSYAPITAEFHLPPERPETPPAPFATIPFSRDPGFVNRENILEWINERCSEPAARVALVGLGGVGKSQLAIEYAHRIAAERANTWVFWIHAGTQARVEEGFRAIADAVKLPGRNQPEADVLQLVYGWLSNERNGMWTMILDSADDRDVFYGLDGGNTRRGRPFATYLPQARNGSIIITTRNNDLAFRLTGRRQNMIQVGPMTQTDALALFERRLGSLPDANVAADLVRALDLVPLAISQAVAYIQARAPRTSPEKYLAEFRESERKRSRLLEQDAGDLRRDGGASNAILTTWRISFDYIHSKRVSAANLLSLMSFFDRQGIPEWVLKPSRTTKGVIRAATGRDEARDRESDGGGSTSNRDTDNDTDEDIDNEFEDDIAMLRDYHLITADGAGDEFKMHGLVQLSTRRWLKVSGQHETFKQQYIKRMAASFPAAKYENWATCRSLFAHVQVALGYQPSKQTAETWATLLYNGGWYARSQGRYDVAEQMLGEARKTGEKRLGKEHVVTLGSTSVFARVLRDQGRWEEAEKLFVHVMEIRKSTLGADHPVTLINIGNLALTYLEQGRREEAEKLFVYVMEARKTNLGVDHPATLVSMGNLACTWKSQGRHTDALALMEGCAQTRQRVLGAEHPDTLSSLAAIAEWSG